MIEDRSHRAGKIFRADLRKRPDDPNIGNSSAWVLAIARKRKAEKPAADIEKSPVLYRRKELADKK